MKSLFENLEKYTLYLLILLYPIFVLPVFSNPYVVPKEILLVVLCSLVLVFWVIKTIISGSFDFKVGKFDLGVLLVAIVYIAATLVKTPNKMEAFLFPGTTTLLVASAILYFLINQLDKKGKMGVAYSLLFSAILLSVSTLFTQIGLWTKIPQLPAFVRDVNFVAFGGNLPALIYLVSTFILSFALIFKENDSAKKLFVGVSAAVILLGIILMGKNALPGKSQALQLTDFQTSWAVGIETLKQSPLFGVGPANYLTAFNLFRPVNYNQTSLWSVRFTTARDFYLTVLTETGFAGIIAFGVLLILIYKLFVGNLSYLRNLSDLMERIALATLLVIFFFLPATPNIVTLLFVLLALLSYSEEKSANIVNSGKAAGILISLPIIVELSFLGFFGSKMLLAEYKFQQALVALSKNNAQSTYDNIHSAIALENRVDRYHAALAQIDMALATSLAGKKEVTDTDKNAITQLVQQAINEGKSTAVLNPQRSGNWEILAQIYRSIMPFAQRADQFAIQTYTQAVVLDPTNPNLRIALGGVYYALGRYDEAIDTFKLAVLAKPDLANAHYNLSVAYSGKKDFDNAITSMKNVLSLVPKDSNDYKLAQKAIEDLEKNKPAKTSTSDSLSAPQPVGTSNVKPPIVLPADSTPPTQ